MPWPLVDVDEKDAGDGDPAKNDASPQLERLRAFKMHEVLKKEKQLSTADERVSKASQVVKTTRLANDDKLKALREVDKNAGKDSKPKLAGFLVGPGCVAEVSLKPVDPCSAKPLFKGLII